MIIIQITCRALGFEFDGLFTKSPSIQEIKEVVDRVLAQSSDTDIEFLQIKSDLYRELEGGRFHTRERYVQEL